MNLPGNPMHLEILCCKTCNAPLGIGSSLSQVGLMSSASRVGTSLFVIPTSTCNRDTWGTIADATKLSLEAREKTWQHPRYCGHKKTRPRAGGPPRADSTVQRDEVTFTRGPTLGLGLRIIEVLYTCKMSHRNCPRIVGKAIEVGYALHDV